MMEQGLRITALPTLVLVRDGKPVSKMIGADKIMNTDVLQSLPSMSSLQKRCRRARRGLISSSVSSSCSRSSRVIAMQHFFSVAH